MRPGWETGIPVRLAASRPEPGEACPELACIRRRLPRHALAWAELRAERLGLGADRALISAGLLDEETYIRALAQDLGIVFESLETAERRQCLLSDDEFTAKAASGLLPLADGDGEVMVIAPRGTGARGLVRLI